MLHKHTHARTHTYNIYVCDNLKLGNKRLCVNNITNENNTPR